MLHVQLAFLAYGQLEQQNERCLPHPDDYGETLERTITAPCLLFDDAPVLHVQIAGFHFQWSSASLAGIIRNFDFLSFYDGTGVDVCTSLHARKAGLFGARRNEARTRTMSRTALAFWHGRERHDWHFMSSTCIFFHALAMRSAGTRHWVPCRLLWSARVVPMDLVQVHRGLCNADYVAIMNM